MVNATVDNRPVSIVLDGGQSTTVPSNETWRVSIHTAKRDNCQFTIDGIGRFTGKSSNSSDEGVYLNVVLVGGQTITETTGQSRTGLLISGFVVNS